MTRDVIGYRNLSQEVEKSEYVLWNLTRRHKQWKPKIVNRRAVFSARIVAEIKQFYANAGLLTIQDVVREYGISEMKLRYNRRRYGLPHSRYGGNRNSPRSRSMVYFTREDVERFLRWQEMGRPRVMSRMEIEDGERIVFSDGVLLFKRSTGHEFDGLVTDDAEVYLMLAS